MMNLAVIPLVKASAGQAMFVAEFGKRLELTPPHTLFKSF